MHQRFGHLFRKVGIAAFQVVTHFVRLDVLLVEDLSDRSLSSSTVRATTTALPVSEFLPSARPTASALWSIKKPFATERTFQRQLK
jgi:hypothetical protein